jgi:hypothetical protein
MHWNYRIARKRNERIYKDKVKVHYDYFIVEAYYDSNGKVGMISQDPTSFYGENVEQLADGYDKCKAAFYAPILDYDNIPEPGYQESADPFNAALKNGNFLKKLEEDEEKEEFSPPEVTEKEMDDYDKECEDERVMKETLYNHLIREFIHEKKPNGSFRLTDLYKKD